MAHGDSAALIPAPFVHTDNAGNSLSPLEAERRDTCRPKDTVSCRRWS